MSFNHSVIWIDHQEAHVIYFNPTASESEVIKTRSTHKNLHHKSGSVSGAHAGPDEQFGKTRTRFVIATTGQLDPHPLAPVFTRAPTARNLQSFSATGTSVTSSGGTTAKHDGATEQHQRTAACAFAHQPTKLLWRLWRRSTKMR